MSAWQPIAEMGDPDDVDFNCVVGWWFVSTEIGTSWEISDDHFTDCATHFCRLPEPPEQQL